MKNMKIKQEHFIDYIRKNKTDHKEYIRIIRMLIKHADAVCFTIKPFLDTVDDFYHSIWSAMRFSVLDYGYAESAIDEAGKKSCMILLRTDYELYDFMQNRKNLFDFGQEDPYFGFALENPAFIKDGEVFCYTISHEENCLVTKSVYEQLCKISECIF